MVFQSCFRDEAGIRTAGVQLLGVKDGVEIKGPAVWPPILELIDSVDFGFDYDPRFQQTDEALRFRALAVFADAHCPGVIDGFLG